MAALLGEAAAPLVDAPLGPETLEHLLRAQAAPALASDPLPGGLTAVQCLLLLALEARQRGDNQRGGAGGGGGAADGGGAAGGGAAGGGASGGGGGGVITSGAEGVSLVELGSRYFLWARVGALVASREPNPHPNPNPNPNTNPNPNSNPIPNPSPSPNQVASGEPNVARLVLSRLLQALALSPYISRISPPRVPYSAACCRYGLGIGL